MNSGSLILLGDLNLHKMSQFLSSTRNITIN